jgi:hypothetical protein
LIPGSCFVKRTKLDAGYLASDPSVLRFEMEKSLVMPVDSYYLSSFEAFSQTYMVASLKNIVDQRLLLLKGLGLFPVALEPSAILLYNLFAFMEKDLKKFGSVAFLEVSSPYSTLSLWTDGMLYPGNGFLTDSGLLFTTGSTAKRIRDLTKFIDDLKAHFDMLYAPIGFKLGQRSIDQIVLGE